MYYVEERTEVRESDTNFIGWTIKDNNGNYVNDKCIGVDKKDNKKIYISYKSFCQATKGYIDQFKALKIMNSLQEKTDALGLQIKLHIEQFAKSDYDKDSKEIIIYS